MRERPHVIEPMRADIADLAARSVELERSIARMEALVAEVEKAIPAPTAPGPLAKLKEVLE